MLAPVELDTLAQARLEDAEALLRAGRFDGALYLCGYSVELALKSRICQTLGWSGYPSTNQEFQNYQSFRTHNLNVLLRLSGVENLIRTVYLTEWSVVVLWNPEVRYAPIGTASTGDVQLMIGATRGLLGVL